METDIAMYHLLLILHFIQTNYTNINTQSQKNYTNNNTIYTWEKYKMKTLYTCEKNKMKEWETRAL